MVLRKINKSAKEPALQTVGLKIDIETGLTSKSRVLEPLHEKTGFLHMHKQRRRSASG